MTTQPMTTQAIKSLANFNYLLTQGSVSGQHLQGNIEARVTFLEKNYPTYQLLLNHYQVGDCTIGCVLSRVSSHDFSNLDESQAKVDGYLASYRIRIAQLQADAYALYVRTVQQHNDKARYDRRMKAKEVISFEAFVAKLPTF